MTAHRLRAVATLAENPTLKAALDAVYARELAELSRQHAGTLSNGAVLASTLTGPAARDLAAYRPADGAGAGTMTLAGESWAIQQLSQLGDVTCLALDSIDTAPGAGPTQSALRSLAWVGLGAMVLAAIGSVWLARTLRQLIDHLSRSLSAMTTGDRGREPLAPSGTSRELDQLTSSLNSLLESVAIAELRRCTGTDFDAPSVEAPVAALPRPVSASEPIDPMVFQWAQQRARSA